MIINWDLKSVKPPQVFLKIVPRTAIKPFKVAFLRLLNGCRWTYIKFCAALQDSLLDRFDFVAGQVQQAQVAERRELDRGEDWIQRVAQ